MSPIRLGEPEREPISSSDRTLRIINIIVFIPALGLLIPHGVVSRLVAPAIGLVPGSFSAVLAIAYLTNKAPKQAWLSLYLEAFVATFLVGTLIPGWVLLAARYGWYSNSGLTMLGSYGTSCLMIDLCIHIWFILRHFNFSHFIAMFSCSGGQTTCPHCAGDLRTNWRRADRDYEGPSSPEDFKEQYRDLDNDAVIRTGASSSATDNMNQRAGVGSIFKAPETSDTPAEEIA